MDHDERQVHDELNRIISLLEEITHRRSRWNGVVELSDDSSFYGKVHSSGNILIARTIVDLDVRWRTEIHEALHTLSEGLSPSDYVDFVGWEEGVIEQTQRLLRPELLLRLGVSISNSVFDLVEARHQYNSYISALESLRQQLGQASPDFYIRLLTVPLKQRPGYIIREAQKLQTEEYAQFRRMFGTVSSVLRGE